MAPRKIPLAQRFWSKVKKTNTCWLWQATVFTNGYGSFRVTSKNKSVAHRVSWILSHGDIPDGLNVLHKCDVRLCVNPQHLFLGTQLENIADMIRKGRKRLPVQARGMKSTKAKLTDQDVYAIRASSDTIRALARQYGVAPNTIDAVKSRRSWSHI